LVLINQAEVLENTRFVRQIAMSKEETLKPFPSINLRGAELGALDLGCTTMRRGLGCADFTRADLQEANLTSTLLFGASLREADLRKANLTSTVLSNALFLRSDLGGVTTVEPAIFEGAEMIGTTLVQAQLNGADFRHAHINEANADDAHLSNADFRNAILSRVLLRHADLRQANFRGANMVRVDLTLADLRGADFTRADLRNAVLTDVCFDNTTKWDSNTPPASSSC
jgi:hypothetical protein